MTFERFTERARYVVTQALDCATQRGDSCVGTEHLLIGLLREEYGVASRVLNVFMVREPEIDAHMTVDEPPDVENPGPLALPVSTTLRKSCEFALREALSLGHNYIGTEHLLLGLVRNDHSPAERLLSQWMGPLGARATADEVRKEVVRTLLADDKSQKHQTVLRVRARLAAARRDRHSVSVPGRMTFTVLEKG